MARHRRRRQTALSGATGRSRRCASGCSGDTRWWCRCGAATARAAATSSATPTAPARTRISVAPARARRWTCSPPSNGRRRSKTWMENDGCSSARAPAGSPRSTPPRSVPTGWSRCSRSRRVARAGRTPTRATPARRSAWPSCSRRSRRGSPYRCCGSTPKTTSTSARGCRACGLTLPF